MQFESIQIRKLFLSEILFFISLTFFVLSGCVARSDSSNLQNSAAQIQGNRRQSNVEIVTQDSVSGAKPQKSRRQSDLETIILEEIDGDWASDNGDAYKLAKSSEKIMLERLLPEAERQFKLSFEAQNAKLSEDLTESNIETTTTTYADNTKTVTKRRLFSRGEEKLAVALKNIETVSQSIGQSLNNLSLVSKTSGNGQPNQVTKNCEETVRKILMTVHENALRKSDEIYKPMFEKRASNLNKTD